MTGRRRVGVLVLLAGPAALLLAGCAGGGGGAGAAGSSGTAVGPGGVGGLATLLPGSSPGASRSGGTASGQGSPSGTGATSLPAAATRTLGPGDLPFTFVTPSRNIACGFAGTEVRCDIAQHIWKDPAKPASCDFDYGHGLHLGRGPADWTCAGDTILGDPTATELAYGRAVALGDLTCDSQPAGVTCRNSATGRGFTLAKEGVTRF